MPPLERPSRISLSFSSNSESSEYEFSISEHYGLPCLRRQLKKERERSTVKFCKFRVEKATHRTPFLYEAMATIRMAMLTSLGAYFSSPRLAAYLTRPFNGGHSHGSIEFPRRLFHVAWCWRSLCTYFQPPKY